MEKFAHIRHACASAAKENALRPAPLLLCAIISDGTHQLCVQPCHCVARDLGDAGDIGICRLGIDSSEAHKTVTLLTKLGCREWLAKFLGNRGGDRVAANWNIPEENVPWLNEDEISRSGSDIHEQGTTDDLAIIIPKSVV